MRIKLFVKLYPIVLSVCAIGGFVICEWFNWHDRKSRLLYEDTSLKYLFTSGPQTGAAMLLLYYACTFHRRGSEFAHQLMVESCLHQSLTSLLIGSVLHSAFHMMHSGCCAFPAFCPVDPNDCMLNKLFQCPKRLERMPRYDFVFRAAQVIATCGILVAMTSIGPIHRLNHLQSRYRRAEFLTFDRRLPMRPASPTVHI